jgi:hypothetical protein
MDLDAEQAQFIVLVQVSIKRSAIVDCLEEQEKLVQQIVHRVSIKLGLLLSLL